MSKVIKNWSYLLVSDVLQQLVGFFVVILLARKLSPDGFGLFNVIISISTIFAVFAQFGTTNVVIRELTLKPESAAALIRKIIIPIRLISFGLAIVAFVIYNYIDFTTENQWIIYVILIILNLSLWNFSESIAFGNEVTKYSSILNIIVSVCWLASIFFFPDELFTVENVILIYCILHFLKAFSYMIIVFKNYYLPKKYNIDKETIGFMSFFKMVLPYVWLLLIFTLANQLPFQLLNKNSGLGEVGYYAVGFKLMMPISIAVGTAFKAIFPSFTRMYANNKNDFEIKLKQGFNLIIVLGTLVSIGASLTSTYWLTLMFGDSYVAAIPVFNFLIWFSVLSILDTLLSNGLSSAYKEKTLAIIATIDVIIIIPLLYFASFYGAEGLAIIKLVSGILFLGFHLFVFIKVLKVKIYNKNLLVLFIFYFSTMLTSLFIDNFLYQFLLILVLTFFVLRVRNSPIIETIDFVKQNIKNIVK